MQMVDHLLGSGDLAKQQKMLLFLFMQCLKFQQKQPPSDRFFQFLGGVPLTAGLELEGVGVDGGLGAVRRQLKQG